MVENDGEFLDAGRDFNQNVTNISEESQAILDAGAGTGILGIAASDEAIKQGVSTIHLVCVENETESLKLLRNNLKIFKKQTSANFTFEIMEIDYLEENDLGDFDAIISWILSNC